MQISTTIFEAFVTFVETADKIMYKKIPKMIFFHQKSEISFVKKTDWSPAAE